jgi:hypothetical protein
MAAPFRSDLEYLGSALRLSEVTQGTAQRFKSHLYGKAQPFLPKAGEADANNNGFVMA